MIGAIAKTFGSLGVKQVNIEGAKIIDCSEFIKPQPKEDKSMPTEPAKTLSLNDLENGMTVTYRVGRSGRTRTNWGKWREGTIYVQKHAENLLIVTPNGEDSAEYGPEDYCGDGEFCCEDYYFQIKNLK